MTGNKFTDDDKQKVIDFLNLIAKKAKFELDTKEVIEYYGLLSFMQKTLLTKIHENTLEVKRVIESEESTEDGGDDGDAE